jgi:beta-lactamase regulating signal transducer with metallopeptidase domain/polyhydroxyalkanoate synthesis regulator phasin
MFTRSEVSWRTLAAIIWFSGLFVMSSRFVSQWMGTRRLRSKQVSPPSNQLMTLFTGLKHQMGIHHQVTLMESGLAGVPMIIGWLKPVVLIPTATLMNLTTDELRLILAHELSHIRRYDHLVNLAQAMIESMLFFHPVTWWLSRQVRIERENCCDDACTDSPQSSRLLANALLKLELIRSKQTTLTLNATGGTFMNRINRLVTLNNRPSTVSGLRAISACSAMMIACGIGLATIATTSPANAQDRSQEAQIESGAFPTTTSIQQEVGAEVRNGKLTRNQADMILRVHTRLQIGIESGKLTVPEALGIMKERFTAIYEGEDGKNDVDAKKRYDDAVERMTEMVKSGKITREQMEQRLNRMKTDGAQKRTITKREYDQAVIKMTEMVKNGEITREQMGQRLDRMKTMMEKKPSITRRDYEEAVANMAEMVKSGEITREQMQQRLDRMKKMIKKEASITEKEYKEAVAKMTEMVKKGEITREQMQQRLDRMKKMIKKEATLTREDYAKAQADLEKMIAAGKITKEEMRQKLGEMRRMMKSQSDDKNARAEYEQRQGRLKKAVEAGKMTQAEADQKLMEFGRELRAKTARAKEEAKDEMSDDCRKLGMRLRQAVADGEMTGEEARAAWESECGGKDR